MLEQENTKWRAVFTYTTNSAHKLLNHGNANINSLLLASPEVA